MHHHRDASARAASASTSHGGRGGVAGDEPECKRVPSAAGGGLHRALRRTRRGGWSWPATRAAAPSRRSWRAPSKPLPPLRAVLPERSGGMLLPVPEPGLLPPLPPPEKRADVAEARARRDGAIDRGARRPGPPGPTARAQASRRSTPGCHRLQLFAVDPRGGHPGRARQARPRRRDARRVGRPPAGARPDATRPTRSCQCASARPTRVEVVFAGSPPGAPVLVAHVAWPLPDHLPALWGSEARGAHGARAAGAPRRRAAAAIPCMLAQGGYGLTPVPLSIEPGACYLAVVTLVKETARSLGLRVHVGTWRRRGRPRDRRGRGRGGVLRRPAHACARRGRGARHPPARLGPGALPAAERASGR